MLVFTTGKCTCFCSVENNINKSQATCLVCANNARSKHQRRAEFSRMAPMQRKGDLNCDGFTLTVSKQFWVLDRRHTCQKITRKLDREFVLELYSFAQILDHRPQNFAARLVSFSLLPPWLCGFVQKRLSKERYLCTVEPTSHSLHFTPSHWMTRMFHTAWLCPGQKCPILELGLDAAQDGRRVSFESGSAQCVLSVRTRSSNPLTFCLI